MTQSRKDKLVGAVVSLPTFCDDDYNLLLDRQRTHIRWLVDHGLKEGSAVLMGGGGLGEGYFLSEDEFKKIVDVLSGDHLSKTVTWKGKSDLSALKGKKVAIRISMARAKIFSISM